VGEIVLEIEFEPPVESICECCGNTTVRLTRFVLKDQSAHAVYYAQFTKGHGGSSLSALVGLGGWGENASPGDRLAFPLRIWVKEGRTVVGLVDSTESPWADATFLGRLLDRDDALAHDWVTEVFHVTDHMLVDDPVIREFLQARD
jgi:hypothetical protein